MLPSLSVTLMNCLALDTAKVDGLFLWVLTDNLHNREAVSRDQVGITESQTARAAREELYKSIPMPCSCEPWPVKV